MSKLCIYHGNCLDGFGAAWAVRHAFGEAGIQFIAANYGDPPPSDDVLHGKDVLIVDFSYKKPVLEAMARHTRTILVLDHHKTAQEDLDGFYSIAEWWSWQYKDNPWPGPSHGAIASYFDMERSGAMLAWEIFHPRSSENFNTDLPYSPPPTLIDYLQDYDLWRKKLHRVNEVIRAIGSYPFDFKVWDNFDIRSLIQDGIAIYRYYAQRLEELRKNSYLAELAVPADIDASGFMLVPHVNAPPHFASDLGNILGKEYPFAVVYSLGADAVYYSLRSKEEGVDVSMIARMYGGGGHKHAAGFRTTLKDSWLFKDR